MNVGEFLDALAARTPTPGGGSAAALLGSIGASLGAMACRFTTGEKFKAHAAEMETAINGLLKLRGQLLSQMDADALAYDRVSSALAKPKGTEGEKSARKHALNEALHGAMEAPIRTMDCCLRALQILQRHAPQLNANLATDLAAGVLSLGSGLEAAWLNVAINAIALGGEEGARKLRADAERIRREAGELTASILAAVNAVVK